LIVLIAVAVGLLLPFTPSAEGLAEPGSAAKPQLRIAAVSPLTVVGTGFRAGEVVHVTVRSDAGTASANDGAGAAGRIAVRFPRLKLAGKCPYYLIAAWGNKGSRTTLRSLPRPCGMDP
jgi:hypothetical protein